MTLTLGFVINPVAGVGGPAGLKGSDGPETQSLARSRGSTERAEARAAGALAVVAAQLPTQRVLTASGQMGADAVRASGLTPEIVHVPAQAMTGSGDTQAAVVRMVEAGADLIVFVGGDGTARDVASVLPASVPMLGVPSGVKMYSGCFAVSPAAAGAVVVAWGSQKKVQVVAREVLDVDEVELRVARAVPRLFAVVSVPVLEGRTQSKKTATPSSEAAAVAAAARGAAALMNSDDVYLLGPGGTMLALGEQLGVQLTPLGVDAVRDGDVLAADASERELLELLDSVDRPAHAVLTVIGGQGFLLGRGNQQFSPGVLRRLSTPRLVVVATAAKLIELEGRPFLIDSGDAELDQELQGYVRVITGPSASSMYPVVAA